MHKVLLFIVYWRHPLIVRFFAFWIVKNLYVMKYSPLCLFQCFVLMTVCIFLRLPKKLSATGLSQQLPLQLMLASILSELSNFLKSRLLYWESWSECFMIHNASKQPLKHLEPGLLPSAQSLASQQCCVRINPWLPPRTRSILDCKYR